VVDALLEGLHKGKTVFLFVILEAVVSHDPYGPASAAYPLAASSCCWFPLCRRSSLIEETSFALLRLH
jgi:hypothetical protein